MSEPKIKNLFGEDEEEVVPRIGDNAIGAGAEFYVCSVLALMGLTVHHMPTFGYDVLVDVRGAALRVQVKATRGMQGGCYRFGANKEVGNGRTSKRRMVALTEMDCDVLAFVAMDIKRVVFLPIGAINSGSVAIVRAEFEAPEIEILSWSRAVDDFYAAAT